jgi:hypothetical protein
MAIQVVYSSTLVEDAGVKMINYAEAGIGKTALMATLPRPVIISAEGGLLSLKKENLDRIFGPSGLPYATDFMTIVVKSLQDLEDAYQWCIHPEMQQYFDSIGIDSLSEIGELLLAEYKPKHKDPRKAYGDMQDKTLEYVKKFRDIPGKHVYMSAKLGKEKDEVTGQFLWGPKMPGQQLGPALPYLFDEVFRYQVMPDANNQKQRVLQTQPGLNDSAKDRSGALAEFEFPHLGYIINKIKAKGN